MNGTRPIEIVASRFEIVHGAPPKMRARCPAHGSRAGTLAIKETQTGTVLVKCFAGCTLDEILSAANLSAGDLFPDGESLRQRDRERLAARRRFLNAPRKTIRAMIDQELERIRERLRAEFGFSPPLTSAHINEARAAVNRILNTTLAPIPAYDWEAAAHDWHPEWPELFALAVAEERRRLWRALNPDSHFRDMPPAPPSLYERIRAEERAARWLHARTTTSAAR